MRDAVGGTFMIRVFLIFLATYIVFIGIALNYAKAFSVKNKVIDIIEQNEGISSFTSDDTLDQIGTYLNNMHYGSNFGDNIDDSKCYTSVSNTYEKENIYYINNASHGKGYCIAVNTFDDGKYTSEYYQVVTFVNIYIPLVELNYLIPVKGETRKIERITS